MIYIDESEPEGELEPAFAYRDVTIRRNVDANNLYEILGEVGRGKFGTVYKCREKESGLKLAAKFVPIPKREDRRNVEREVEIMNSLQHHLIIQLYAAYEYQKMMVVVLELIGGGELFDRVVDDEFVLNELVCVVFIRQVCEAMEFIHRNNILHLDLKPENILCLTQNGNRIKIIDFGLARKYDPNKRLQILFGTPEFVAPEVVNFDCISYATDMWSVGVICYVLISGLSPFMGETDIETMANVTIAKYDFEDEAFHNITPECIDFISKLLVKDVSTRMTAEQCMQHKWLRHRANKPSLIKTTVEELKPNNKNNNVAPTMEHQQQQQNVNEHILNINGKNEELIKINKDMESTKDNLKNFIERWEEHPNSPYVFDIETNSITPLTDSISSSRACSPSPCASLDTMTDDELKLAVGPNMDSDSVCTILTPVNESRERLFPLATASGNVTPTPSLRASQHLFNEKWDKFDEVGSNADNFRERSLKSYLHTFDRRNSDTSYLVNRRPSGERINLADEIRKLSDHLLMLAQINTKLGNETKSDLATSKKTPSVNTTKTTHKTGSSSKSSSTQKTLKSSTIKSKESATTSTTNACNGETSSKNSLSKRLQQSIEETPTLGRINVSSKTTVKTTNKDKCTETAKTRRSKFRVNQMSRDVPIGLPNTHQPVNLEEAANTTKDCLLHLLEKYNESKSRNPLSRHQSISVDWNFSDNLEHRSMSSINAFFQRHTNTGENVRQLQAQLESKTLEKKN